MTDAETGTVREAVGVFFDDVKLKEAIADLRSSGFEHDRIGLLASEHAVAKSLGDIFQRTNEHQDESQAPVTAFVRDNSVGDTFRALEGSLFFIGTSAAMGAVVASAAVFGGALLAAIGGAVAVGTVGTLLEGLVHQSDAEYLEQQLDEGHLLLFVRADGAGDGERAIQILNRHAAYDARVYEVPAQVDRPGIDR